MIGYAVEGAHMKFIKAWVCHDWLRCWRGMYGIDKSMSAMTVDTPQHWSMVYTSGMSIQTIFVF